MSTKCTTPLLVFISVAITLATPADDFIETLAPCFVTTISSPPTVFTLVDPSGIWPASILFGNTCLNKIPANVALFSGFNNVGMVPSGSFANASLVGAKTVKSPSPLSVPAKSAAFTAANRVDKEGSPAAVAAIDFKAVDL